MHPKDIFGVAVRVVGLLISLAAGMYIMSSAIVFFMPDYSEGRHVAPAWHYLMFGMISLIVGLYLLRGASHVVSYAYSYECKEEKEGEC